MDNLYKSSSKKTHIIVISVSLAIIAILVAAALMLALGQGAGEMSPREEIEANLSELEGQNLGHERVWRYLIEYGIGGFNTSSLEMIENTFATRYIGTLPDKWVHAHETATLFLSTFYGKLADGTEAEVTDALIRCYVAASGDRYAVYRTAEELEIYYEEMSGSFVGIGVQVENKFKEGTTELESMLVKSVMEGGGALEAGILAGDYIVAIDGVAVTELGYDGSIYSIRGEIDTVVSITVLRGGEERTFNCIRRLIQNPSISYSINEDMVGYIKITEFVEDTDELFIDALDSLMASGARGIVFDLRDNPGGMLDTVVNMLSVLAPKGTPIVSYQDKLAASPTILYADGESAIKIPLAFICNENTASAGELFCSTLRDWCEMGIIDVASVGTTTYGKGVMQRTFANLQNGSSITLTISYYNPPSGENYDGIGITPIRVETDEELQLEYAYLDLGMLIAADGGIAA